MKELPAFFKVFLRSRSSERLPLPLAFALRAQRAIPEEVFLRNSQGRLWPLEVAKIGKKLFFQNGWVKFVEDNKLVFGDMLVFFYDGCVVFDFKLLGRSECEKEFRGSLLVKKEPEDEEEEKEGKELEMPTSRKKAKTVSVGKPSNGLVQANTCTKGLDGHEGAVVVNSCGKNKRTDVADDEDDKEIFDHGIIPRPKGPYFVTRIRAKRRNELYIPMEVIKDHDLKLPETVKLLDEEGRKWSSKVKVWKDGRTWLSKGWRAFCKWNNLRADDRCICEIKRGRGPMGIFFNMKILRAGSWLPSKTEA